MARNGSGTYNLPAGNPVTTGTTISSTWANSTLSDMATALTGSIASDGQTTASGNLPMGGFIHTNVGNATVRTNYASAGQVQDGTLTYLTSVAGTDTITAVGAVGMTAYATGQKFTFVSAGANTGAATININSIGAKALTKNGATALSAGDIPSGAAVEVVYDGTQFQVVSAMPVTATGDVVGPASATDNAVVRFDATTGKLIQNSVVIIADTTGDVTGVGNLTASGNLTAGGIATIGAGSASTPSLTTTGDTNTGIFFPAADTIAFAEGGVESMRINASGNVGIGGSPAYRFDVTASAANSYIGFHQNTANTADDNMYLYQMGANANAANATFLYCHTSTTQRFTVKGNGGIANYQANDTNLSDERVKKDIVDAGNYLTKICAIPVKTFLYKDQSDTFLNLGVIAQDVEAVAPELVDASGFGETPDDGVPLKSIYQTDLQYALMKCIQELNAKFEEYKASHP